MATEGVTLLNDWFHLKRALDEGKFNKRLESRAHLGFITLCIDDLRAAPTVAAFEGLRDFVLLIWRLIGEGRFATYFEKIYLVAPWDKWYLGASTAGVGTSGQQCRNHTYL
jgi:hypothetical protein